MSGYPNLKWDFSDSVTDNLKLEAHWNKVYQVTLQTNGGTIAAGREIKSYTEGTTLTLPGAGDITRGGYTFAGWYEDRGFSGSPVTEISSTDTGDKTLYAKWSGNTYIVKLEANGGKIADGKDVTDYTCGTGAALPGGGGITREGYTFEGWYTDASFAEDTKWNSQAPLVAPVTLYAKWSINEYTIQFSNTEFTPITFTVEDSVVLNNPYKQGYDFVEWRDENNQVIPPTIENTARNMTLTAVWKKIDDLNPVISGSDTQNVLVGMTAQDKTKAEQVVQSAIDTIGTYPGNPAELVQKIKDEIALGNVLSGQIAITALNEQSVSPADMVLIHDMLNQLNDSNYQFTIGHLMDISILVRSNSTVVGSLSALPEPVKFSIAVPEQMQNSGRVFKVLRLHDNHISVIDSEYSNGIVAFETDEFSTYALVYGDMKAENQMNTDSNHAQNSGSNEMQHNVQTGDNTYLSITLLSVLLAFSLTLVIVLVSKKKHKKDE